MNEEDAKKSLELMVETAKNSTTTLTLNLMSQYMSLYHARRDDESLIKMNYCMLVLLMKQGLFDIEQTRKDMSFVLNQRELLQMVKDFKS
jgi:hypothetical protein